MTLSLFEQKTSYEIDKPFAVPQKLNVELPCVPAILLLDISPKDLTTGVQTNIRVYSSIILKS